MSAMRDMSPIIDPPHGSSFINRYGVSKYLSVVLSSDEVASSNIIKDGFLAEDNKRISLQRDRWQITAYSRKRGVQLIFPVTAFEKFVSKRFSFWIWFWMYGIALENFVILGFRDSIRYRSGCQNGWIFGKLPWGGGHFQSKNSCWRFWTLI